MSLKNILLKLLPHHLAANELMFSILFHVFEKDISISSSASSITLYNDLRRLQGPMG